MGSLNSARYVAFPKSLPKYGAPVPTSLTDLTTTDTLLYQVTVSNTTAGSLTYLLQDKQGTPFQLIPTVTIQANQAYVIVFPEGIYTSGLSHQASGAGIQAQYMGGYR